MKVAIYAQRYKKPRIFSEQAKINISNGLKKSYLNGNTAWNKGKTIKTDIRILNYVNKIDYNNPNRINKIRESKIGKKRFFNEQWRKNLSEANKKKKILGGLNSCSNLCKGQSGGSQQGKQALPRAGEPVAAIESMGNSARLGSL